MENISTNIENMIKAMLGNRYDEPKLFECRTIAIKISEYALKNHSKISFQTKPLPILTFNLCTSFYLFQQGQLINP
jgi:hypothetical protein